MPLERVRYRTDGINLVKKGEMRRPRGNFFCSEDPRTSKRKKKELKQIEHKRLTVSERIQTEDRDERGFLAGRRTLPLAEARRKRERTEPRQ